MRLKSVIFRLSHSSRTRISPIDYNLQDFARNLLPTHFASEIAGKTSSDVKDMQTKCGSAHRLPIRTSGESKPHSRNQCRSTIEQQSRCRNRDQTQKNGVCRSASLNKHSVFGVQPSPAFRIPTRSCQTSVSRPSRFLARPACARNQREDLRTYTRDDELSIDNNVSRQEVIGLFSLAAVPQVFERQKATMQSPVRSHSPSSEPKRTRSCVSAGPHSNDSFSLA